MFSRLLKNKKKIFSYVTFTYLFLDPSNPLCHSWKIASTFDWSPFFEHWFPQYIFAYVSRIHGRHYCFRGPQRSIFSSWKSRLSFQLKWVRFAIFFVTIFPHFSLFPRSMENLAKEINENCQSIPRHSLTVELDGKRRVSTCSGYSTTTGNFFP